MDERREKISQLKSSPRLTAVGVGHSIQGKFLLLVNNNRES